MSVSESSQTPTADPFRLIGRTVGDFFVERLVGRGGMGEVYLARQVSLPRSVALKILKPELAANEQYLRRFEAEARSVAPIHHPNIVSVYAIGEYEGLRYIALEYVRGIDLRRFIEQNGALAEAVALRIARLVASALVRAAEAGIIHRDIKPENVLLTRRGDVKVADFGLARTNDTVDVRLTQTGVTMGTPLYMSPEQIQGHSIDARSDLYSLGIVCYQMLAGEPPFRGETAMAVAIEHVHGKPEPLSSVRPDVHPDFLAIIDRLMAKLPGDRYQTAREVLIDLESLSKGESLRTATSGASRTASVVTGTTRMSKRGRIRQALAKRFGWLFYPPYRRWLVTATVLAALLLGAGGGAWIKRQTDFPSQVTNVLSVPVQETGFMQYSYANSRVDDVERERAHWAVLVRHLGDDTYPLLSARYLAEYYRTTERFDELHWLSSFLNNREDLTMKTMSPLLEAMAWAGQEKWARADQMLDRVIEAAERRDWPAQETSEWIARHFFLTDRQVSAGLGRPAEKTVERRERFWKVFQARESSEVNVPAQPRAELSLRK